MAELMNDYVVDDSRRRHHAFPVECDVAGRRAGCPAIAEFADGVRNVLGRLPRDQHMG